MIGEGGGCKARKPEADVYQSFVSSSCIISTGTTVGDASKAYGSDSITLLILGCRIAADPNQNAADFEERTLAVMMTLKTTLPTVTQHGKNGMYANRTKFPTETSSFEQHGIM